MAIIGYILAILIGLSLGLIGGGGSILAVPVLVFFFNVDPVTATTYSLFIVGFAALTGSINHARLNNISYKTVTLFGIPSVIILFITRHWLVSMLPSTIISNGTFIISKSSFILYIFSLLMLVAGWTMIRRKTYTSDNNRQSVTKLILQGATTGAVTGFIGIGGGFIIVPSLVLFAGLPMKKAIGTSLTIIIINCVVGLASKTDDIAAIDFRLLTFFAACTITGILIGTQLIRFVPDKKLKHAFGWVIIAMSIIVIFEIVHRHI